MSRITKKIIYGSFYILVACFMILVFYRTTLAPEPSCIDGAQNGNERGVDCGGSCPISCEVRALEPLRVEVKPRMYTTASGFVVLLATVTNPNQNYAAENVAYEFQILNTNGIVVERIPGKLFIYGAAHVDAIATRVITPFHNIHNTEFSVETPQWKSVYEIVRPEFDVPQKVTTSIEEGRIFVRGALRNMSAFLARDVRVRAVIQNKFSEPLFLSETILPKIQGFSEETFSIPFPIDETLVREADVQATEIDIVSQW